MIMHLPEQEIAAGALASDGTESLYDQDPDK
jgi:hypothetical protein